MNRFLVALSIGLVSSAAIAQTCYENNLGTSIGVGDDVVLAQTAIGFSFPFAGSNYTDVHVCTNGFFYLSNAGVPAPGGANCCTGTTAALVAGGPKICPFFTDLNMLAANSGAVWVNATATQCTITWDNAVEFGNTVVFDLQCQLFPSGEIRFIYGGNVTMRTAGDCLVGLSPGNGAAVPAASNFAVAGLTPADTAFELFNNAGATFDLPGKVLAFTPAGAQWVTVPTICFASTGTYGIGCITQFNSFYENFAAGTHDLSGTSMRMINTGTGYIATNGGPAYVPPSSSATPLSLTDDSEAIVTLSATMPLPGGATGSLAVCSNGFVSAATGNGTGFTPSPAAFLAMPNTVFSCWHDYNPAAAGSGQVKFEEIAGVAYITWDGVSDFNVAGSTSTWQMQFDVATGNVNIVWVSMSGTGNAHVVGYSLGGASNDSGSIDLSARLPSAITVFGTETQGLALAATGVPAINSTMSFDTSNIPAGTPFGAVLIGFIQFDPGIDLTPFGMAGCFRYTDGSTSLLFIAPGTTQSTPFTVPNNNAFHGLVLATQSATYSPPATTLGAISSNGLLLNVGF